MDSSQCDFQGVSVPDMAFIINDQRSIEKIKNKYNTDGVEKWLDEENFIQ